MPALLNLRHVSGSPITGARIREVLRLKTESSPAAQMLVDVLLDSRTCPAAPRIEAARRKLESSTTPLDYPHARTVGAMAKRASAKAGQGRTTSFGREGLASRERPGNGNLLRCVRCLHDLRGVRSSVLELSPILADAARAFWTGLGLSGEVRVGDFADTFEAALDPAPDVVFVDGNHQEEPTWDYFQRLADVCAAGSLLVFDDITWSDGMRAAWSPDQG